MNEETFPEWFQAIWNASLQLRTPLKPCLLIILYPVMDLWFLQHSFRTLPPKQPPKSRLFFLKARDVITSGTRTENSHRHGDTGCNVPGGKTWHRVESWRSVKLCLNINKSQEACESVSSPEYVLMAMDMIQKDKEMAKVKHNTMISVIILTQFVISLSSVNKTRYSFWEVQL